MKMFQVSKRSVMSQGASLAAICVSFLLAGCQMDEALMHDRYRPNTVAERYPITVKKMPVKTGIVAPGGALKPDQVNAVIMFANRARTESLSGISVKYPSGGAKARASAEEVVTVLANQGIPEGMIRVTSYPGSISQPIQMSYSRKVAVTKECGDWSRNLASESANRLPPNFGCSFQHNVAAMVANPSDFEQPRAMSPVMASNRSAVMNVYVANETAGDYFVLDEVTNKDN